MQRPTCTNLRVRTARDAETLFHAVALGMLPMITRRLDSEERMALTTGFVYVWEERTSVVSDSLEHGIERFTEGRSWGPSRFVGASGQDNQRDTDHSCLGREMYAVLGHLTSTRTDDIFQDFLFYNEKQTAPKSMMVERTRALRYVDHCQM